MAEEDAVPGNAYKMIPDTRRELKEGKRKKKTYLHTERRKVERNGINKRTKRERGTLKGPNSRDVIKVSESEIHKPLAGWGGAGPAPISGVGRSLVGEAVAGR